LHFSTRDSVSRRPCPTCAAAAPSKPNSRPKLSHATKTPGVESMSVLKERDSRISGHISRVHITDCRTHPCQRESVNRQHARGASTTWRLELRGRTSPTASTVIVGMSNAIVGTKEPDRCVFKLQLFYEVPARYAARSRRTCHSD
jgi:hypothetical protein